MRLSNRTKVLATAAASVAVLGVLVPVISGASVFSLVGAQSTVGNCSNVGGQSTVGGQSGQSNVGGQSTVGGQSDVGCITAPTDVWAEPSGQSADVTWVASSDDGGSPIFGYIVLALDSTTSSNGGQKCYSLTGATSCQVLGLTAGDTYTFTVTPVNADGPGPTSAPSEPIVPIAVPGTPTDLTVTAGNAFATLTWTAPTDGGPPIISYSIGVQPIGGQEYFLTVGAGTTATVTGLTNGVGYVFMVAATNGGGTGSRQSSQLIVVGAPPTITSASSTTYTKGVFGSFTPTASGLPQPTIVEKGAQPPGLKFASGKLSGIPTAIGSFHMAFTADNGVGAAATQAFTLTVVGFHVTTILPPLTRGTAYSQKLAALGGKAPYVWKSTTALPAGLKLGSSGLLSGTVPKSVAPGGRSIKVTVTDATLPTHQVASAVLALKIS